MPLAAIILLVLKASIAVLVFAVGADARPRELAQVFRRPRRLIVSLVSMNLVMLAIVVAMVLLVPLQHPVRLALVALALAPVPPVLPRKLMKAGGEHHYVTALLFTASIFAIVWIPVAGEMLDRIAPAHIAIPPVAVAKVVSITVLGPVIAGLGLRLLAPALANRIAPPAARIATVLLLGGLGLLVAKSAPAMLALLRDGTLFAIVLFLGLGLLTGHLLGGPTPGDRSVLALATASRHPGVALAIAQLTFPAEKAVAAALLLYLLVGAIVTMPYVRWRRKALGAEPPVGAAPA